MNAKIAQKDLEKWTDFILLHSLGGINPGDVVMVKGEHITWPLLSVIQDKIIAAGATADINMVAPDNNRGQVWGAAMAKHGALEQIEQTPHWHQLRYEAMTKYIEILGAENPSLFANLPAETSAAITRADESFRSTRLGKRWVLTLYPTEAFAQLEGMSLAEYTDIIVKASTVDPRSLEEVEEPVFRLMSKAGSVTLRTEHPGSGKMLELRMDISGRSSVKCTGKRNFPDGEVYTSPDANSVTGEIFVDLPVYYDGVTLQGIYLKFKKGVITSYKAEKEHETLKKIIETDDGSHRLGEVAFGMNRGIKKALKHPLFVEKVAGTMHIAIGASYSECFVGEPNTAEGQLEVEKFYQKGMLNRSAVHVDIVTDFRPGGCGREVYLDDTRLVVNESDNLWIIP
ncbi:MAG: aminopeptidase [Candidatus Aminicenantes bacterium]|nr:aminopeptidase [Candidatus Aminicenantes bacterium]